MANQFYLWRKFLSRFGLWKSEKNTPLLNKKIKNNIELKEGGFTARVLEFEELEMAYQFRYKIFSEELKWLPLNKERREIDAYDQFSIHFGIFFQEKKLVGYGRFVLPKSNFMLEKEFKDLIQDHIIRKKRDTVEVSRVAIDKSFRPVKNLKNEFNLPTMLLYKLMYHWSIKNKIRFWYITIEPSYLKRLQKLFPWKQIGTIKFYQPNIATTAAILDLREAENFLFKTNQKAYDWFIKY